MRRLPPTFIPATPWSHPAITIPAPRPNSKVDPRFQEASNSGPRRPARADVIDADLHAGGGLGTGADDHVLDLEGVGRRTAGNGHGRAFVHVGHAGSMPGISRTGDP